jgi:2-hydroxychromene-2-carboxylate isomerase
LIVSGPPASFYFDLSSPEAYLAAERILHLLPGPAEWQPVLAAELPGAETRRALGGPEGEDEEAFRARITERARELGLQPLRWPEPFPFDSTLAMRVATYAKSIGRAVPFAQAAFRQAFAGGRSLEQSDHVLIAAAACEMHPAAVLRASELRSVERELSAATARAAQSEIIGVPAVRVGGRVFPGDHGLEDAAAYMGASSPGGSSGSASSLGTSSVSASSPDTSSVSASSPPVSR